MAEINTRIQLKHDTLAKWNESTLALKYGEAAVAFVDTATTDAKGNIIHVPTALMKVGDSTGTKTFKDLPFLSAPAVDVYAWAKAKDVELNGKILEFKNAAGAVIHSVTFNYMTQSDVEGLLANYYTKTDIDGKLEAINQTITDLDVSALAGRISNVETAVNTTLPNQINAVDKKFENYTTTANQQVIDAEQDRRIGVIEGDYLKAADIANFETKENVKKVADDLAAYEEANDAAVALKADKSVVDAMYTNSKIDELVQGAKDYADTNDANTEYHVEYDSTNKKIKLVAGADASKMEIDATDFIKDGMIETVTIGADNDLVITFNTAAGKEDIVLPLDQLVDIYTGVEGARVKVTVASDKSISAELVAGSITKNYLDADVQASLGKADTALQSHQDISHLATSAALNKAIEDEVARANGAYDTKGAAADAQQAAINDAAGKYETKGTAQNIVNALNLATTYEPIGAESRAIAAAKTETENQIKALNIADYEKKANLKALAYKDKVTSSDFANEVFIFNCGTSEEV